MERLRSAMSPNRKRSQSRGGERTSLHHIVHSPEFFGNTVTLIPLNFNLSLLHSTTGAAILLEYSGDLFHRCGIVLKTFNQRHRFSLPPFRVKPKPDGLAFAVVSTISRFGR